ncbi:MAG TPA: redoxin domain-containing protein [Terriglobales bacterium]|nr:redoxin domain-containing protein [Terriglobales bacterium]
MLEERLRGVIQSPLPSVGDAAPDFELPALVAGVRKALRLSDYRPQKKVILAFYPSNWEQASERQLASYQNERTRLLAHDAETVGVSVDSIMNATAWERVIGPLDFPLCSDFWPHGEVAKRYGVLEESGDDAGSCRRAVFVIDHAGIIVFRKTYDLDFAAPVDDIFAVLETT